MADVVLKIGGRDYAIACRDGGEDHLRKIAEHVDRKALEARRAVGDSTEARQLLFASLLLADEMAELRGGDMVAPVAAAQPDPADLRVAGALAGLARRIESIADALESKAANG